MINPEFSNEFDVLYNNITSNQAPGLNEYEKSVFLTNAQNDIIRAYFNPRENKPQQGFDESKKRQIDFSALMKTKTLDKSDSEFRFDNRSVSYRIPNDLLLFVNEACVDNNYRYVVLPISYDEYDRLMLKPYQYPIKRCVWRLIVDSAVPSVQKATFKYGSKEGHLNISNSTNKEVTFSIMATITAELENEKDENGDTISRKGIGRAPVITETPYTVDIKCEMCQSLDSTNDYWSTFLYPNKYTWSEKLHSYIGDMSGTSDSTFPNIPVSELINIGKITVVAPPATPFIELIGRVNKNTLRYTVRYLRKPRPIVLTDLGDGLSIQGVSTESTCELDDSLHLEILQRAVESAKAAYTGDLQSQIALGQASRTDIGAVQSNR